MFRVDCDGERVEMARIVVPWWRVEEEKRSRRRSFISVLAVVALCETPNHDPILLIKFHGLNRLFRWGLDGVIPKSCPRSESHQIVQSLFNIVLGLFSCLNKLYPCG